jgi:hypothetical protein
VPRAVHGGLSGKEKILLTRLEQEWAELRGAVERACVAVEASGPNRVEAGLAATLEWVATNASGAHALLVQASGASAPVWEVQLEAIASFVGCLRENVPADGRRPEAIEELLVAGVVSILCGLVVAGEAERAPGLLPSLSVFLRQPYLDSA